MHQDPPLLAEDTVPTCADAVESPYVVPQCFSAAFVCPRTVYVDWADMRPLQSVDCSEDLWTTWRLVSERVTSALRLQPCHLMVDYLLKHPEGVDLGGSEHIMAFSRVLDFLGKSIIDKTDLRGHEVRVFKAVALWYTVLASAIRFGTFAAYTASDDAQGGRSWLRSQVIAYARLPQRRIGSDLFSLLRTDPVARGPEVLAHLDRLGIRTAPQLVGCVLRAASLRACEQAAMLEPTLASFSLIVGAATGDMRGSVDESWPWYEQLWFVCCHCCVSDAARRAVQAIPDVYELIDCAAAVALLFEPGTVIG